MLPPNLDDLLRASGVSLRQLERSGALSRPSVSRWRRGVGRPQLSAVVRLAAALGLDVATVAEAVVTTIAAARRERAAATTHDQTLILD
jgi:transcriptional regulator with XRE-family HTH domain